MRTREDQIEVETDIISKVVKKHIKPATCKSFVHRLIMEAELRAEQRVRAEIGRDSERLDWLERQFKSCTVYMNGECSFSPSPVIRNLKGHSFRQAIDAAREVG